MDEHDSIVRGDLLIERRSHCLHWEQRTIWRHHYRCRLVALLCLVSFKLTFIFAKRLFRGAADDLCPD